MTRIHTQEMTATLSNALERVVQDGDRIIVETGGSDVAAIVTMEDYALLQRIEDYLDGKAAEAALAEPGDDIPWEVVKKALDL